MTLAALAEAHIGEALVGSLDVLGHVTTDAEPVMGLSRVELEALLIFAIVRVPFLLVTVGALLKLIGDRDVFDGVMTPGAGNT